MVASGFHNLNLYLDKVLQFKFLSEIYLAWKGLCGFKLSRSNYVYLDDAI